MPVAGGLEARLDRLCAAARRDLPAIALDERRFRAWLVERIDPAELEHGQLAAGDLWLACACAHGDRAAVAALEAGPLASVAGALARMARGDGLEEEALQILRHKMLVERPPRIASYRGEGSLASWPR